MLKAVIFDLDHTLVDWDDAEPWEDYQLRRLKGVYEFVDEHVHPLRDTTLLDFFEMYAVRIGQAWQTAVETLTAPCIKRVMTQTLTACGLTEDQIDIEAVLEAYDWQPPTGERAYPDVLEVLPQLQAYGVEMGVITNASQPMHYRDRELAAFGLLDFFPRCRLSAADVGYIKPHRIIFDRALALLESEAHEAVFVGDSLEADIRGAQLVGMYGVWRARVGAAGSLDGDVNPDGTITTLHDLLHWLDEWYPGWRNGKAR
jgi:putative hydrolase of the HAD superfamily